VKILHELVSFCIEPMETFSNPRIDLTADEGEVGKAQVLFTLRYLDCIFGPTYSFHQCPIPASVYEQSFWSP